MPNELFIEGLPERPEPFAVQLSSNDQRFTACCVDALGRVFVAWHDPNLNVVLCELMTDPATGRPKLVYRAGDRAGAKDSCVTLCVERDDYVRVFYGARPAGATSGEFPLMTEELRVSGVRSVSGVLANLQAQIAALGSTNGTEMEARVAGLEGRIGAAGQALLP